MKHVTVVVKRVHVLVKSTEVAAGTITETQLGQSASLRYHTQPRLSLSDPRVNGLTCTEEPADPPPAADKRHFTS